MILIATDEAGYGPKLGPLVISASVWKLTKQCQTDRQIQEAFAVLREPFDIDGSQVVVDDSKAVFKPASAGNQASGGYRKLQAVVAAGSIWSRLSEQHLRLIQDLAGEDITAVESVPWLRGILSQTIDVQPYRALVDHWNRAPVSLQLLQSRFITAAQFNRICDRGLNKSDLLSSVTLQLVKQIIDRVEMHREKEISVWCDRHGGRRYYAGILQATFDSTLVRVVHESKTESTYRVPYRGTEFSIRFRVKGDSLTPVAYSSIVSKYLREKAMESLNQYFVAGDQSSRSIRPTAGYPVDADRFLGEISSTIQSEGISLDQLVRNR